MNPETAQLLEQLKSADESDRRYAAEDLGALRAPEGAAPLVGALRDEAVSVREAAVDALVAIGGQEVCQAVIRLLYAEETFLRNYAVEILQALGEPVIPAVSQLCTAPRANVRKLALDILGAIPATCRHDALEQIVLALDDANVNVAAAAAEALGTLQAASAVEALTGRLGLHAWLDATILLSLARIGDARARAALGRLDPERFRGEAAHAHQVALSTLGLAGPGREDPSWRR